jgi:hypothetical protein
MLLTSCASITTSDIEVASNTLDTIDVIDNTRTVMSGQQINPMYYFNGLFSELFNIFNGRAVCYNGYWYDIHGDITLDEEQNYARCVR